MASGFERRIEVEFLDNSGKNNIKCRKEWVLIMYLIFFMYVYDVLPLETCVNSLTIHNSRWYSY